MRQVRSHGNQFADKNLCPNNNSNDQQFFQLIPVVYSQPTRIQDSFFQLIPVVYSKPTRIQTRSSSSFQSSTHSRPGSRLILPAHSSRLLTADQDPDSFFQLIPVVYSQPTRIQTRSSGSSQLPVCEDPDVHGDVFVEPERPNHR